MEKLIAQIQRLTDKVAALQASMNRTTQLTYPLDPITKRLIQSQQLVPVSFILPGTTAQTAANYGIFFQADRPFGVLSAVQVHATAAGAAATLQLEKLSGTTAPGSGTALLTSTFNLNATANTPQYGSISASAGVNALNQGDRLAVKLSGTPTASANVVVTVFLIPL